MIIDPGLASVIGETIKLIGILIAVYFSIRSSKNSEKALKVAETTEKNTNSMKDALVTATAKASFAAGEKSGRNENNK